MMIIYRVYEQGSWGDCSNGEYFLNQKDAEKRLREIIQEKRKDKYLAGKEDLGGHRNLINCASDKKDVLKNIQYAYWYKCSYEYDEWDIGINYLIIKKIEVKE